MPTCRVQKNEKRRFMQRSKKKGRKTERMSLILRKIAFPDRVISYGS